ncbi:MAG: ammonium transporter [Candidatus Competibacterales bacterium]
MNDLESIQYALDTFYLSISSVLVMWMAAGFAMLEAGFVRAKNTAEILTKNVLLYAVASVTFALVSYPLIFGENNIGALLNRFLIFDNFTTRETAAVTTSQVSQLAQIFHHMVFAATAISIVSGAVAERMRLWSFLFFAALFVPLIYPVSGWLVWGGGWLAAAGFRDYAGAGVVHLAGAGAALAGVLLLGARRGKYSEQSGRVNPIVGANLPLAVLGVFILWMGWFGFNGGAALQISDVDRADTLARVLLNTNLAAAAGVVVVAIATRLFFGFAELTLILNGALAGLVAITADPVTPSLGWALFIGAGGALVGCGVILSLEMLRVDDPVGAIGVHGGAAVWGLLLAGLAPGGASLVTQALGIAVIFGLTFTTSLVMWGVVALILGLRIAPNDEMEGLDLVECGLEAYPEFVDR